MVQHGICRRLERRAEVGHGCHIGEVQVALELEYDLSVPGFLSGFRRVDLVLACNPTAVLKHKQHIGLTERCSENATWVLTLLILGMVAPSASGPSTSFFVGSAKRRVDLKCCRDKARKVILACLHCELPCLPEAIHARF